MRVKLCPKCGSQNELRNIDCFHCGTSLFGATPISIDGVGQESPPPPRQQPTNKRQVNKDDSYIQVISIIVPKVTEWNPSRVLRFAEQMARLSGYLGYIIHATHSSVRWMVEVPKSELGRATAALKAYYPEAQLQIEPKTTTHIGYWLYHLEAAIPYIYPLPYIDEFKQDDPLVGLVTAMEQLGTDEEIVYELVLTEPRQDWYSLGRDIIKTTVFDKTIDAAFEGTAATERQKQTRAENQQAGREKLSQKTFNDGVLGIKVRAATKERSDAIADLLNPSFSVFQSTNNVLLWADSKTFSLVLGPKEIAALWHLPNEQHQNPKIQWVSGTPLELFELPAPPYNLLGTAQHMGQAKSIGLSYSDRIHINIVGESGMGKSTLLHNLIHQDILNGKTVAVIDPHGDLINEIVPTIPDNRLNDVIWFDPTDKQPLGFNLLSVPEGLTPDVATTYILSVIKKLFGDEWGRQRMDDAVFAAIRALLEHRGTTIQDIPRMFLDQEFREEILSKVERYSVKEFWELDFGKSSADDQRRVYQPINSRLRSFYRDPIIEQVICKPHSLSIRKVMDTNKIFLTSLAGIGSEDANILGALLINKFLMAALSRAQRPKEQRTPVYLYIDEVRRLASTSLTAMFSEARKYGLYLTTASQTFSQLGESLEEIMGNVGTNVCFAVKEPSARVLISEFKPAFAIEDLVNLSPYHIAVRMRKNQQTYPALELATPPPVTVPPDGHRKVEWVKNNSRRYGAQPTQSAEQPTKPKSGAPSVIHLPTRFSESSPAQTEDLIADYTQENFYE